MKNFRKTLCRFFFFKSEQVNDKLSIRFAKIFFGNEKKKSEKAFCLDNNLVQSNLKNSYFENL